MRCYECMHWVKGMCTEKFGECRVDGPGMTHDSVVGRWPVTRSSWGCARYKDRGLDNLVATIKEEK